MGTEIAVLVVDEDADILELTETFLERESDRIAVRTEQHAPSAVDRASEVDCIVSDLRMPEMDGIELCSAVRDADPEMPFFLFTAAELQDVPDGCNPTGVVQKGTGTDHYTELVERIVDAVTQ